LMIMCRFKVIVDVATALVYLHTECEERIIHRDVKAANVMLDAKFNARLGDFGLARSYNHSLLHPESTNVAGTLGYLAPELFYTGERMPSFLSSLPLEHSGVL
jgi:serine/threonine protein kinase